MRAFIHYTPEGAQNSPGLNFSVNWRPFWFRLFFVRSDGARWYFRFRSHISPHFIMDRR